MTHSFFIPVFLGAIALSGVAFAADTTIGNSALISPLPVHAWSADREWDSASQWSGGYVGVHLGYGSGITPNSWSNSGTPRTADGDIEYTGPLGGLHGGYQTNFGAFVVGAEADFSVGQMTGNDDQVAGQINSIDISAVGTVRGRVGYAYGNFLAFATAGVAAARFGKNDVTEGFYPTPNLAPGLVVGGGVEVAVTDHLRARAEYQYIHFSEITTGLGYAHHAENPSLHIVRGGLSYAF